MASTESGASADAVATKLFTRAEVAEHNDCKENWLIIHNGVYNLTKFLNQHPGGEEILIEQAGKDATEPFEEIGHSSEARQMMIPYKIGELVEEDRINEKDRKRAGAGGHYGDDDSSGSWRSWLIPIALGLLATLVYRYFISTH